MFRSLWTAASGMTNQQINVDTISNNIANINTAGYKKENAEFKSLLYQTIQDQSYDNNGNPKPSGIQVGLGVRNSAISSKYTQGTIAETDNDFDLAIDGKGFFMIQKPDGSVAFTRSGNFQMANDIRGLTLATSDGNPVLDTNGQPIVIDNTYDAANIIIDQSGRIFYKQVETVSDNTDTTDQTGATTNTTTTMIDLGIQIGVAQFNNPNGLVKSANSLMLSSEASGETRLEATDISITPSKIKQGYLEGSNVQAVDEMVNLIVAQRAYEMNSKVITATDEMMQQANNLR